MVVWKVLLVEVLAEVPEDAIGPAIGPIPLLNIPASSHCCLRIVPMMMSKELLKWDDQKIVED